MTYIDGEVIPGEQKAPAVREFDIRNGGNDLGEK
jgi:hypothetical protein